MLKALIKARLASFWAGFGYDRKTGKRRKTGTIILMGALYVYLVAVFLFLFLMLFIGLIITMGIGSSFSTVPLIAAIYVPLCVKLGISPLATVAIVGIRAHTVQTKDFFEDFA